MRSHPPLPAHLAARPFSVAEGRAAGISRDRLLHRRFVRPYHGVRVSTTTRAGARNFSVDRARACAALYAPRLRPGEFFSHTTALALLGCPIRFDPRPHVTSVTPQTPTRAAGVYGHRTRAQIETGIGAGGLPIAPAGHAFLQAAGLLTFRELVVAADHLILTPAVSQGSPPIIPLEQLRRLVASASSRGVARARDAVRYARVGAESRMETILRLLLARFGIDSLALQVDVSDRDGRWIGRFDLVDLTRRLIVEFDGEQHRTDDEQYERDQVRIDRAREAGFTVLRFRKRQVLEDGRATAQRVADALGIPLTPVTGRIATLFEE